MRLPGTLLLALCILPAAHAYADDCGINQKTLDQRAIGLQQRHPGGLLDKPKRLVTWRQKSGDVVSVRHAGCMDLGTEIRVNFGGGKSMPEQAAVGKLISAVRTYWDGPRADELTQQMAGGSLARKEIAPGTVEWTSSAPEASPYRVTITSQSASVSWLDG